MSAGVVARSLLEPEAYKLLTGYGLPVPRHAFATTAQEACDAAAEIGFPAVLKVVSPDILHKSDVGGVKVGLRSKKSVRDAFRQIREIGVLTGALIQGALIVEQAKQGTEVIVGGFRDEEFGPVVMFGMGGVLVEVLHDVAFGLAPVTREEAMHMVQDTLVGRVLSGVRGRPAADLEPLTRVILAVSQVLIDNPDISEIDLNPVMVYQDGCAVLDARVLR